MQSTTFWTPRAVPISVFIKRAESWPLAASDRAVVATEAPLNAKRRAIASPATGHENTFTFELTAKNGKWIAVCHDPSKRNDGSNHALAASKLGNSAITMPLDGIALQTLKTAVVDEDLDLVTCEGCRILSQ